MAQALRNYERGWAWLKGARGLQAALLALLVAACGVAVWGIVTAHREASRLAWRDQQLQLQAHARSLEASLASSRSEFLFLTQSPPIAHLPEALGSQADAASRRWRRLDAQATVLLYMTAHPEVRQIRVRNREKKPELVAGRRIGAPLLLPLTAADAPPDGADSLLWALFPIGDQADPEGSLEAFLDRSELLRRAVPSAPEEIDLSPWDVTAAQEGPRAEVRVRGWNPDGQWALQRRAGSSGAILSTDLLAQRYRSTLIVSLGLMALTLPLGLIAFRQHRRSVALQEESRQRARIQELERQVWHNERLASLGRMAAGIAHEINNPLEGMTNYLSVLEDEARTFEDGRLGQVAARIREGAERVADVTRQVLIFSDPGKAPRQEVNLKQVIEQTFSFVSSNPSFRQLDMSLELPDDALLMRGSPVMLGQLLLNLLLNAAQVQGDQGEIQLRCWSESGQAVIEVADRGPGILSDQAAHIFEPFYSTRGSAGLGLAVCLGIVSFHQGMIEHHNRPGGGTLMQVRLPLTGEGKPAKTEHETIRETFAKLS